MELALGLCTAACKTGLKVFYGSYPITPASDILHALAPFKNSVGVGTRLYLRQIVLPLLGLDFGYGLEARDFQIYLAIGLTD